MMSKALIPSEMKNPGLDWLGSDPLLLDNRNCEFSEQFEIGYDHNHNHRCEENANPSLTTQYYVLLLSYCRYQFHVFLKYTSWIFWLSIYLNISSIFVQRATFFCFGILCITRQLFLPQSWEVLWITVFLTFFSCRVAWWILTI